MGKMKISIRRERVKLYIWIGLAFLLLNTIGELINYPETILKRIWNSIWLISYLIVINYLLFEYTLPYIKLTWKRILIAPLLLFGYLMLYSFGSYAWRHIGIQLHAYFPLIDKPSFYKVVEYQMAFSMSSVFFFGIIRHIYNYIKLKQSAQKLLIEKQRSGPIGPITLWCDMAANKVSDPNQFNEMEQAA